MKSDGEIKGEERTAVAAAAVVPPADGNSESKETVNSDGSTQARFRGSQRGAIDALLMINRASQPGFKGLGGAT